MALQKILTGMKGMKGMAAKCAEIAGIFSKTVSRGGAEPAED